jgi:hypothetical protein
MPIDEQRIVDLVVKSLADVPHNILVEVCLGTFPAAVSVLGEELDLPKLAKLSSGQEVSANENSLAGRNTESTRLGGRVHRHEMVS